ncbi:MAG: histidine phosphatase family protein [Planctomycetota bacterium]|nr:MAG: histidine phosphatase family protein [Planctomycetota bacterium]
MVPVVLIRPCATDYDEQGRILGTLDVPLSEQGSRDIERIVEEIRPLGITAVYCGPCESARQTGESIAEALGVKMKKLDNLRNIDHGLWQGMLIEDVKRKQPKVYRQWQEQPNIICPPEGEMLSEATERVQAALSKTLKKHKEGPIALVVPDPLAGVVQGQLLQREIGDFWKTRSACGKWEVITAEPQNAAASHF